MKRHYPLLPFLFALLLVTLGLRQLTLQDFDPLLALGRGNLLLCRRVLQRRHAIVQLGEACKGRAQLFLGLLTGFVDRESHFVCGLQFDSDGVAIVCGSLQLGGRSLDGFQQPFELAASKFCLMVVLGELVRQIVQLSSRGGKLLLFGRDVAFQSGS